ncbi:MAG: glucosamine-6-phosphate deaminase [Clostridia bacterium]|nr:glucosamine-6-phosphate deaminase [Clostridia bacterium]
MNILICDSYGHLSEKAAEMIARQVNTKPDCVLGLATGSTPIGTYAALTKLYEAGKVDFSRVTSYNLDEYYPMSPENPQSYRYFMEEQLFRHINIRPEATHVPDGATDNPSATCADYDRQIEAAGGIDLQLLGIGQNGHIGFNEPGATLHASTHLTPLTEDTIAANARFFSSPEEVPTHAISMGMGSILRARSILLLISGKNKHAALSQLLSDKVDPLCPATFLKLHPCVTVLCDREAYDG